MKKLRIREVSINILVPYSYKELTTDWWLKTVELCSLIVLEARNHFLAVGCAQGKNLFFCPFQLFGNCWHPLACGSLHSDLCLCGHVLFFSSVWV